MYRILSTLLFFLMSGQVFAAMEWEQYLGCYKTLSVNGRTSTAPNELYNRSTFTKVDSLHLFMDMNRSAIPGIEINLYNRYDEDRNTYLTDYVAAMLDRGTFNENTYSFEGYLRYAPQSEIIIKLTENLKMTDKGNGIFIFDVQGRISMTGFNQSITSAYELQRIECD